MTETERLYRDRLQRLVQAKLDAGETPTEIARACFPRADGRPDTHYSGNAARRKLAREMGTDPSNRTSDGLLWSIHRTALTTIV